MAAPNDTSDPVQELRPPLTPHEARAEAARCLYCYEAPCSKACPGAIDVASFIRKIATDNMRGAARTLLQANALAASCARVCPVDELCEGACVLNDMAVRPIAIGRLQRHVMDWAMEQDLAPAAAGAGRPGKVAIVGAGPSGLTCAAELRKLGYSVTVFDGHADPGGLNTYAISAAKITPQFAVQEARWLERSGFELKLGTRIGADIGFDALEADYQAIFLGLGLEAAIKLAVPGEELGGVVDALELIEASRSGATLPTEIAGRDVVVIGGGNTAVDAAILALQLGAGKVRLVYRRTVKEMPAYQAELNLARELGVMFDFLYAPVSIQGDGEVEGIICQPMELGEPDSSGRRRPEPSGGPNMTFPCQVVIPALGQRVNSRLVDRIGGIKLDWGRILVNEQTGQTTNPRYFAGGDCVNGGREVVHAVAQGKRAAAGIHSVLGGE